MATARQIGAPLPGCEGEVWAVAITRWTADCVERGILPTGRQAVRDTKDRVRLLFESSAWQAFVDAVRDGELDG